MTNIGRMDLAIEQILAKGYLDPFRGSGKKLFALGINFDPETHNLADTKLIEITAAPTAERQTR